MKESKVAEISTLKKIVFFYLFKACYQHSFYLICHFVFVLNRKFYFLNVFAQQSKLTIRENWIGYIELFFAKLCLEIRKKEQGKMIHDIPKKPYNSVRGHQSFSLVVHSLVTINQQKYFFKRWNIVEKLSFICFLACWNSNLVSSRLWEVVLICFIQSFFISFWCIKSGNLVYALNTVISSF